MSRRNGVGIIALATLAVIVGVLLQSRGPESSPLVREGLATSPVEPAAAPALDPATDASANSSVALRREVEATESQSSAFRAAIEATRGVVLGTIVDMRGEIVPQEMRVYLWPNADEAGTAPNVARAVTVRGGHFRFGDLPVGRAEIEVDGNYDGIANGDSGKSAVEVVAGESVETTVVLDVWRDRSMLTVTFATSLRVPLAPVAAKSLRFLDARGATAGTLEPVDLPPGSPVNNWRFAAKPDSIGPFRVELRDPRFVDVDLDPVYRGDQAGGLLRGSGAFELSLRDAVSGEAIEGGRLDLEVLAEAEEPVVVTLDSVRRDPVREEEGRFVGLLPGDYRLIVRAPGHRTTVVPIAGVKPRELRRLDVALDSGDDEKRVVRGRVTAGNGPAVGVMVECRSILDPRVERIYDARSRAEIRATRLEDARKTPPSDSRRRTDENGRFEFGAVEPGVYVVDALVSKSVFSRAVELDLTSPGTREVELSVPAFGGIRGQIVGLRRHGWTPATILALLPGGAVNSLDGPKTGSELPWAQILEDGTFELTCLPATSVELALAFAGDSWLASALGYEVAPRPVEAMIVSLGTVNVVPGAITPVVITPPPSNFSALDVLVRIDGDVAPKYSVDVIAIRDGMPHRLCGAETDAQGRATFDVVPIGEVEVLVVSSDNTFGVLSSESIQVVPGSGRALTLDVRRIESTVRCVDADGNPLAERKLFITMPGVFRNVTLDAAGEFRMSLPSCLVSASVCPKDWESHSVPYSGDEGVESARFQWPPAAPVRLSRP